MPEKDEKAWQAIAKWLPDECKKVLQLLKKARASREFSCPTDDYELTATNGAVLGPSAELAWPDQKLAVVMQIEDGEAFEQAGWRCWLIDDSPDTIAQAILDAL